MNTMFRNPVPLWVIVLLCLLWLPGRLPAHCDTFDGPVLIEAKKALASGNVTPLLKWVPAEQERAIQNGFAEALRKRVVDSEAADATFFDLLVRIHREGEGASFTGVKPLGTPLPSAILAADRAIESGASREVIEVLSKELIRSVRAKFDRALAKKRQAERSVAEGREYVDAYVEYVHHVEAISRILSGAGGHDGKCGDAPAAAGACSSCAGKGR